MYNQIITNANHQFNVKQIKVYFKRKIGVQIKFGFLCFGSVFLFHQNLYFYICTYKYVNFNSFINFSFFFPVFHKTQKNNSGNEVIKQFFNRIEFPCIPHYQISITSASHLSLYTRQGNDFNFDGKQFTLHVQEKNPCTVYHTKLHFVEFTHKFFHVERRKIYIDDETNSTLRER